jgi:hypothetical protein
VKCGVGFEYASSASRQHSSGSGKSVGQMSKFRGEQPVNNQHSSEAEDDPLTHR